MKNEQDDVAKVLEQRLENLRSVIEQKQLVLRPLQEEERKLERMLREYTSGSMGSGDITDDQIISYIRRHAQEGTQMRTPEIAAGLGIDARGLSKRLPRMARDGLLAGTSQDGYYVAVKTRTKEREPQHSIR